MTEQLSTAKTYNGFDDKKYLSEYLSNTPELTGLAILVNQRPSESVEIKEATA